MNESNRKINNSPIKIEKKPTCSHCGSENVYGMSRVVGYFARVHNFNNAKIAEFKDRQKGQYDV